MSASPVPASPVDPAASLRPPHDRPRPGGLLRALRGRTWGRVRTRLALVVAIPATAFTAIAGVQIAGAASEAADLSAFAHRAELARPVAALVTALQDERDRTAGELAGAVHDAAFDAAVGRYRTAVDAAWTVLRTRADADRPGFAAVTERFTRLADARTAARTAALPPTEITDAYTTTIGSLFALLPAPETAPDPQLVAPTIAVLEIARAKEEASRLRADLYAACRGRFSNPENYEPFAEAVAGQRAALDRFRAAAGPEVEAPLADTSAADAAVGLREQILRQVRERSVTVSPDAWWGTSSGELAVLGLAERNAAAGVSDRSAGRLGDQRTRTLWLTALILAVLVITLGSWLVIGRSIVRSLRDLRRQALDVAQRRLPEAIERLRAVDRQTDLNNLPTTAFPQLGGGRSGDEIGEVGDAFAAVHASAVRLAGEQAQLRRGANAMIVNVARRSQALVERQLTLLDEVQSAEEDPDQLANLFRLDHLLTRMRRNDENLLVLAGADTSRRRPDPVPLSAVVLAAMAEIEEYERVMSDVDDGGYIAGGAVADVVHILAELLDNATSYSAPDTTVTVIGRVAPDGRSAIVRISDRGLGMTDRKIVEANEKLGDRAGTPGATGQVAAATAQMGLWVVGRLAGRHGVAVRLRALNSGVQAEIAIPEPLLAPPPNRSYVELARSVLRASMTHLLGRELAKPAVLDRTSRDEGAGDREDVGYAAATFAGSGETVFAGPMAVGPPASGPGGDHDASGRATVPIRTGERPVPYVPAPRAQAEPPLLPRRSSGSGPVPGGVAPEPVLAALEDTTVPRRGRRRDPVRVQADAGAEPGGDPGVDDAANLDSWTRPIRLPTQHGRPGDPLGGRPDDDAPPRRDRPHLNAGPAMASAPVGRPHVLSAAGAPGRPAEDPAPDPGGTGGTGAGAAMVPPAADGGTSQAGLPVRVPMAQLPHNPLAGPPVTQAGGDGPDEDDPAEVSAALNRFYRGRHSASSDDTLG